MEPQPEETPELPRPTLWPVAFAVGIVCVLVGLVLNSWPVVGVGGAIAAVFGFLWAWDVMRVHRPRPAEPERPGEPARPPVAALAEVRVPRKKFLEGATLGLGAAIGGVVTVPSLFLAIIPPFLKQGRGEIDVGPLSDYPEGEYVVVSFLEQPEAGEVSRRTAYIRNNGVVNVGGKPQLSFTILSNRCAHLGCPVQPNALPEEARKKVVRTRQGNEVALIPVQAPGFGCPCHAGQYDVEGNRTAGPPVRALDRYEFSIRNGRLFLGGTYSVSRVDGAGARARIHKFVLTNPGNHVDGWEAVLYPWQPPR